MDNLESESEYLSYAAGDLADWLEAEGLPEWAARLRAAGGDEAKLEILRRDMEAVVARGAAPYRILVVDDMPDLARTLGRLVKMHAEKFDIPVEVETAGGVADALGFLTEERGFDAVVVDFNMKDGSGFDLIAKARACLQKAPPFTMVTANTYDARQEATACGLQSVLIFDKARMDEAAREAVSLALARDAEKIAW